MDELSDLFVKAFVDNKCVDVELMFFEHSIKASRFVLSSHSSVLEQMLADCDEPCKSNGKVKRVQIDNCNYDVMYQLVRGMYSGKLEAPDIYFAIELYKVRLAFYFNQ